MDGSLASHYDYDLPADRIARYPTPGRDGSRLLVLPPEGPVRHEVFPSIREHLRPGDLLVLNESRVLPARLLGRKPTGAPAEVLLIRPVDASADPYLWEAIVRPGGKLRPGRRVELADGVAVEIVDSTPDGGRIVRIESRLPMEEVLDRHGRVPLPPYLEREEEPGDRERYQTVYARVPGSVAAPTAGLHFTPALLDELGNAGVRIARIVLHVGIGTFRPMEVDDPSLHRMHEEEWEIGADAAEALAETRAAGGRVWAVGTTAVRTLESAARDDGTIEPGSGRTDLFIHPGWRFRVVDGLLTNFHLPRSTLLMLVAALAGYDRTMAAYREAVREGYRFFSYGDAMAVLPRLR